MTTAKFLSAALIAAAAAQLPRWIRIDIDPDLAPT